MDTSSLSLPRLPANSQQLLNGFVSLYRTIQTISTTRKFQKPPRTTCASCAAKNPFKNVVPDSPVAEALSCAECACDGLRGNPDLLKLYINRAVQRKVKTQEAVITEKKSELRLLQEQIERLEGTLHNLQDTIRTS